MNGNKIYLFFFFNDNFIQKLVLVNLTRTKFEIDAVI